MPEVDEVIDAPARRGALELRARWRLGRALKARRYSQAIVLPNTWKSALVPFFADIPVRSGYVGESRFGLLNLFYRSGKQPGPMPLHYARLSEAPGREPRQPLPEGHLRVEAREIAAATRRFAVPEGYAVLCPGAEYGPAKRWPYFGELAAKLEAPVVLLGARGDVESSRGIAGINLVGETTLDEAVALLAGARFAVSNDSGLMHVAAALGTPQVALFGSSSPERTPPLSARARVLWLHPECSPCFARECPLGHFRCLRELPPARVLAEIAALGVLN